MRETGGAVPIDAVIILFDKVQHSEICEWGQ